MKQNPETLKWRTRVLCLVGLLVIAVAIVFSWKKPGAPNSTHTTLATSDGATPDAPNPETPVSTRPNAPAASLVISGPTSPSAPIDRETAIRCLKAWARDRDGHDVAIVSAQDIRDLDGSLVALNVLATTRVDSNLSTKDLAEHLSAVQRREVDLRSQLKSAYDRHAIPEVNRLVAEITEARSGFATTEGIISYKVSLQPSRPPVLAYWPGLPFEMVREESARQLAASRLGADPTLAGLVYYTGTTALLHFTGSGRDIYIDPFKLSEVSLTTVRALRSGKLQRSDSERDFRIKAQWQAFLAPTNAKNPEKP